MSRKLVYWKSVSEHSEDSVRKLVFNSRIIIKLFFLCLLNVRCTWCVHVFTTVHTWRVMPAQRAVTSHFRFRPRDGDRRTSPPVYELWEAIYYKLLPIDFNLYGWLCTMYKLWVQGSTNCGILPSPMREHGVSLENMENMEKMENDKGLVVACYRYECDSLTLPQCIVYTAHPIPPNPFLCTSHISGKRPHLTSQQLVQIKSSWHPRWYSCE